VIIEPKSSRHMTTQRARPRFRGLVRYMLEGKGAERCTWYMAGLVRYMLEGKGAERCTWYMAENLPGLDRREDA